MGFCLFNTVAVAADLALARADVERLAILDFDVHHGNGTVDIFRDRPEVLVCSTFQFPHYPGRGHDVLRPQSRAFAAAARQHRQRLSARSGEGTGRRRCARTGQT